MMAKPITILVTQHGSHLYGTNRPGSDVDLYEIYDFPWQNYRPKKQAFQTITDQEDRSRFSLERFTSICHKGVPQSLEALFSPEEAWEFFTKEWYDIRAEITESIQPNWATVMDTYGRTAKNFFDKDDFKKNRHALRLCHNAADFKQYGQFSPRLSNELIKEITRIAELPWRQREEVFKDLFFSVFGDIQR